MKEEELQQLLDTYNSEISLNSELPDLDIWWANPYYDTEAGYPGFTFYRMFWFTPPLKYEFARWYIINFYFTVVEFILEIFLFLAIFRNMLKKNSEFRNFYYLLTFIIMLVDMFRFFLPADYSFAPSYFLPTPVANTLRNIYINYGFFMTIFIPTCQLALTLNRMTAVVFPLKHKKVNTQFFKMLQLSI